MNEQELRSKIESILSETMQIWLPLMDDKQMKVIADKITKLLSSTSLNQGLVDFLKEKAPTEVYKEITPSIRTHKAKEVALERSKIGRLLTDPNKRDMLYDKDRPVATGKTRKADIIAIVNISFTKEEMNKYGISIPAIDRLTPFDLDLLAHISSLYEAGNSIITCEMIYSQMSGGRRVKVTPLMREKVYKSLARLRHTSININAKNEFDKQLNTEARFEGALLPNEILSGMNIALNGAGNVHECIKILDKSVLHRYAEGKRQISNMPVRMLDVKGINNTEENITIAHYLLRAYADMRNEKAKRNNIILYETLYKYLGVNGENEQTIRNKKGNIRKTVRAILNAWKKAGYLAGFEELDEEGQPPKPRAKIAKVRLLFPTAIIAG